MIAWDAMTVVENNGRGDLQESAMMLRLAKCMTVILLLTVTTEAQLRLTRNSGWHAVTSVHRLFAATKREESLASLCSFHLVIREQRLKAAPSILKAGLTEPLQHCYVNALLHISSEKHS